MLNAILKFGCALGLGRGNLQGRNADHAAAPLIIFVSRWPHYAPLSVLRVRGVPERTWASRTIMSADELHYFATAVAHGCPQVELLVGDI